MSQEEQALALFQASVHFKAAKDELKAIRAKLSHYGTRLIEYGNILCDPTTKRLSFTPDLDCVDFEAHLQLITRVGYLKQDMERWAAILKGTGWSEPD